MLTALWLLSWPESWKYDSAFSMNQTLQLCRDHAGISITDVLMGPSPSPGFFVYPSFLHAFLQYNPPSVSGNVLMLGMQWARDLECYPHDVENKQVNK